jgi:hypothetical protein
MYKFSFYEEIKKIKIFLLYMAIILDLCLKLKYMKYYFSDLYNVDIT